MKLNDKELYIVKCALTEVCGPYYPNTPNRDDMRSKQENIIDRVLSELDKGDTLDMNVFGLVSEILKMSIELNDNEFDIIYRNDIEDNGVGIISRDEVQKLIERVKN